MPTFTRAIVRPPADTFANGLTSGALGPPDFNKACEQHEAYRHALARAGLRVTELAESRDFPDATFVEDVAVVTGSAAMLTRPGAQSRRGEVDLIRDALSQCGLSVDEISAPATLDGGDVCDADGHFFIGLSERTNADGAEQLARWLSVNGRTSTIIDVRELESLLHFKSGFAYLGDDTIVAGGDLSGHPAFRRYRLVPVVPEEAYASNCIRINDRVLVPAGYPRLAHALGSLGYTLELIDVSEFQKMDGGLSCLSLRF
ncbi:MAG TPA: arginine deiminase family protein [Candidatus Eremiobacteraceae bacterium]